MFWKANDFFGKRDGGGLRAAYPGGGWLGLVAAMILLGRHVGEALLHDGRKEGGRGCCANVRVLGDG